MHPGRMIPLTLAFVVALSGQAAPDAKVKASLVAGVESLQPGTPAPFLVKLDHPEHWHTYWPNPGEAGKSTTLAWTLPAGWKVEGPAWPSPKKFVQQGLVNYVHEGELLLPITLTPPAGAPTGEVELKAALEWLECDDENCVPGAASLSLRVLVKAEAPKALNEALRAKAESALPVRPAGYRFSASKSGENLLLAITAPPGDAIPSAHFFPVSDSLIDPAADQGWAKTAEGYALTVPLQDEKAALPAVIEGVLVAPAAWQGAEGNKGLKVSTADPATPPPAPSPSAAVPAASPTPPAVADAGSAPVGFLLLLGAFVGGLLLNLMPCVFPVISLKVMSFVQQAHGDPRKAFKHGLVFAFGVLLSFWVFAAIILALKSAGQSVGWGFQFQDHRMSIAMAFLFTLLALNFFGVFEFGNSLTGVGMEAQSKEGYAGSFYSGVLAVLVATPCTGPFMGGAIGAALNQPGAVTVLIFTLLGLGMALPYLLMGAFPKSLDFIPRPGEWMNTFKQVLGFLMLATVVFMYAILADQKPASALVYLTGGLILAGFGAWVFGRWGEISRPARTRAVAAILGLLTVAGGVKVALSFPEPGTLATLTKEQLGEIRAKGYVRHHDYPSAADQAELSKLGVAVLWKPWSAARVAELQAEGKAVFVDFTATWCATCQVNKRAALHKAEVEKAFVAAGVEVLEGDFTHPDEAILQELKRYGRAGVPLYLLHGKQAGQPPVVLPNTLTPGVVLDALKALR